MTDLDEQIKNATVEQSLRYPLMGVKDNLKELRIIGELTQDYIEKLNPEIMRPGRWEAIPQIAMDFIREACRYLSERKRVDVSEVYLELGNIMKVAIAFAATDGDKEGTLNPVITIGSDMDLGTTEYDDDLTFDQAEILKADDCNGLPVQFFDDRKVIKEISMSLKPKLATTYGIKITDSSWALIPCAFVAFFRCAKKWLIEHKNDTPYGVEINFGNIVHLGIQAEGMEDEEPEYYMYITPGQEFKRVFAKGDDKTESANKED